MNPFLIKRHLNTCNNSVHGSQTPWSTFMELLEVHGLQINNPWSRIFYDHWNFFHAYKAKLSWYGYDWGSYIFWEILVDFGYILSPLWQLPAAFLSSDLHGWMKDRDWEWEQELPYSNPFPRPNTPSQICADVCQLYCWYWSERTHCTCLGLSWGTGTNVPLPPGCFPQPKISHGL